MDKLQQVPLVGEEGKEPGSAAGQLDEDDLRDAESALNEADHDGPAADQQEPSDGAAPAQADLWRAWSALYPAPVDEAA